MTLVKICGLSTPDTLDAALNAGADMVGFVFFAPSPRHLSFDRARGLAARVGGRAKTVALTVDADDGAIDAIIDAMTPDILQLHGAETPARVAALRARTGRPIMKAIGIASSDDVSKVRAYEEVADTLLFDAKPPRGATLPGGNGIAFDWTILREGLPQEVRDRPWMLSGGLSAENVADAIHLTGAPMVDVSSGVETTAGVKDPAMIRAFIDTVRALYLIGPTG